MRSIFFGSSSFSVPSLRAVAGHVAAVVTKRSKPKGRGYMLEDNEVKLTALELGLPSIEIDSFKDDAFMQVRQYEPELFVVISFGLIIPRWALDIPSMGAVNVHPSLLPFYRGPSPMQWAILNGDEKTGITLINMNEKMDAGRIIYQEKIAIEDRDNFASLSERLAGRSAEILSETLCAIESKGMAEGVEQDHERATYTPIITKEMGRIIWDKGALEIVRRIRAFVDWPTAYTKLDGLSLKIFDGNIFGMGRKTPPGSVINVIKEGIVVETEDDAIVVREVQLENKKRMKACDFANGYRSLVGKVLG